MENLNTLYLYMYENKKVIVIELFIRKVVIMGFKWFDLKWFKFKKRVMPV